nr:hypothetical protein Iba_chr13dCG9510 [Ipomoea batatas]
MILIAIDSPSLGECVPLQGVLIVALKISVSTVASPAPNFTVFTQSAGQQLTAGQPLTAVRRPPPATGHLLIARRSPPAARRRRQPPAARRRMTPTACRSPESPPSLHSRVQTI